jgi:putative PIN family toxin of toxin-antitoxin system
MNIPQIVLDTSVVVAAARSRRGASSRVMESVGTGRFDIHLSLTLVLEYEQVLRRGTPTHGLQPQEIENLLDYLCSVCIRDEVIFRWRPKLADPDDDFLLELAVAGSVDSIVTHNIRDFAAASMFGIKVVSPGGFLHQLESRS